MPEPGVMSAGAKPSMNWISKNCGACETTTLPDSKPMLVACGDNNNARGPIVSPRSVDPRSLNTSLPNPCGGSTNGSSIRKIPLLSKSGANVGVEANPIDDRTTANESRSSNEFSDESMIGAPNAGVNTRFAGSTNNTSLWAIRWAN